MIYQYYSLGLKNALPLGQKGCQGPPSGSDGKVATETSLSDRAGAR